MKSIIEQFWGIKQNNVEQFLEVADQRNLVA
jgi:hypothetical protein